MNGTEVSGVVREAAECRMETFNSQRERPEKSQINGGNTKDGLSDKKRRNNITKKNSSVSLPTPLQ